MKIIREHEAAQRHFQECEELRNLTTYATLLNDLKALKSQFGTNNSS